MLFMFAGIVYAWFPGNPPQAAPGEGNVELKEALWTKNGPAKIFYNTGNVGIGTDEPGTAKLSIITSAIGSYGVKISNTGNDASTHYALNAEATGSGSGNVAGYFSAKNANYNYGVYIGAPASGANNWSLYSSGTAKSYFNGSVGIGTASPSTSLKLDVEGKVGATHYCDQNGNNCVAAGGLGGGGGLIGAHTSCSWSGWTSCAAWQTSSSIVCPVSTFAAGYQRRGCSSGSCSDSTRCEQARLYCCN